MSRRNIAQTRKTFICLKKQQLINRCGSPLMFLNRGLKLRLNNLPLDLAHLSIATSIIIIHLIVISSLCYGIPI